jgi:hypothetical protein
MSRGPVPEEVWEQRCTCPGTERARRRLAGARRDREDFASFRERSRREGRGAGRGAPFGIVKDFGVLARLLRNVRVYREDD